MKFNPHDYQQYAINYIIKHRISAVLLDMGLGKTVITLTAIKSLMWDYLEIDKVLVIAPIRVANVSWPDEINKWDHLKDLKYSVVCGSQDERLSALKKKADIYIINRENVQWLVEKSNVPFDFDMIVIDELSSFKSHQSKRFKALLKVRPKVKRIVGLTATPSPNSLMDLFAEFKLLDMGKRLGRYITRYRQKYFVPEKRNGSIVYSYRLLEGADKEIYKQISDITMSMKAIEHIKMPELIKRYYPVQLAPEDYNLICKFESDYVAKIKKEEITAANAAVLTGKLVQLANGAIYDNEKGAIQIHDKKLDALEDIIEAMNGKPLLVAYWYKHDLEKIERRLNDLKVNFARLDNQKHIKAWNEKQLTVGLIHPASAGHGLNLQAGGSTLVWYSLTWSLELYEQTIGRLYRQGQSNETVVVEHIVATNTIDEKIIKVLNHKGNIQNALIEAVKAEIGGANDN